VNPETIPEMQVHGWLIDHAGADTFRATKGDVTVSIEYEDPTTFVHTPDVMPADERATVEDAIVNTWPIESW
jgi:hypothetical protein